MIAMWKIVRKLLHILWAGVRGFGRLMGLRGPETEMDGRKYEVFVGNYLKKQGFRQVLHTGSTGDFGVDLVAKKHGVYYAVQCKYYTGSVSGSAVQEAVAGMACYRCDQAMVVTNSKLTRGAKRLAEANQVIVREEVRPDIVTVAGMATPERVISVAVCAVLSVYLLPRIQTEKATNFGVYVAVVLLCYLIPRCVLGLLRHWYVSIRSS